MKPENDFFEKVYQVVRQVPKGKVTTYGAIAKTIGAPKSARTVGYAMNACLKSDTKIPAHRVVNRNGLLTGKHHFPTPTSMQECLEAEGHQIQDDQITDFKSVFWDPFGEY
jgi:methylated-DNA-protein-cysteine methyltransferase-like protein